MNKITSATTLAEVWHDSQLMKVLAKHHLPCLGCPMAAREIEGLELGEVCKIYGLDEKKLLQDLNQKNQKV